MTTTQLHPVGTAAVDAIVASAPRPGTLRDVLRQYAQQLQAAGAFAHLTPEDARTVGLIIGWDALQEDDGSAVLRRRADAVASGWWGGWGSSPAAVAGALVAAAAVLDEL